MNEKNVNFERQQVSCILKIEGTFKGQCCKWNRNRTRDPTNVQPMRAVHTYSGTTVGKNRFIA